MVKLRYFLTKIRKMKINTDLPCWQKEFTLDINAPFSPIDKISFWLRDEKKIHPKGWASVHQYHCLYFCLKGAGELEIDGIPYQIRENEVIGVLPHQPHRRLPSSGEVQYILMRFVPDNPEQIRHLFGHSIWQSEKVHTALQEVINSYETINFEGSKYLQSNELGLRIALLIHYLSECVKTELTVPPGAGKRINEVMQQIFSPENIGEPLQKIAKQIGITPGHLTDLVHDTIGYSPRHIRRVLRMRLAEDQLLHTTLTVSEIAENVGYKSVYAFSRFFKITTGSSPNAYRKKYGQSRS